MPGAYAHITLVNLVREPSRLEAIAEFPEAAIVAILDYFKYCELGSVSPDYPYLAITDRQAAQWADLMHYTNTGAMIHAGVERLRTFSGAAQQKAFAWLCGYAAHVATDVTIHPVVELKVGPYHTNQKGHRVCEMHQDAYIFQRMNLDGIGLSEHLDTGVGACGADDGSALDADIKTQWQHMLQTVHGAKYAANPPNMDRWHSSFRKVVDGFAEEGYRLLPLARHVGVNQGLTYPTAAEIDMQYIANLAVPGGRMHYDDIFSTAMDNVARVWGTLARAVYASNNAYATTIGNWNLDTGKDGAGKLVFWS